jgi:hypothetical protein
MQLIINTTPAHDAALADVNAQNYPPNPILRDFATSLLTGKLDDLVADNQDSKLETRTQLLKQSVDKLTAQDFATIRP